MALSTRQVNISLRFPTNQTTATITFIPDLASGDGQVLLEETYTATITGGAGSTTLTGSINLPVKSSGYIGYRVKFPRETGYNEHYVYINAGSAIDLSELLTLSAVQGTDLRLDDLSDVAITSAASGDYLRYDGTNWVDSTIQAGDLPSSIDATKIGAGTVDNTEFGYLNGVSSSIQTQLDGKVSGSGTSSGTNTGDQNLFSTIAVSGQSNVVADSTSDTLTLVAGSNITLTTNATTDSITIAASSSGDVAGPASSTDNAVTRFDSTTGKLLQNSTVLIDDNGKLAQVDAIDLDITPTTASNAIGRIIWNTTENSPEVGIGTGSVTSLLGIDQHVQVYNDTGSDMTKGQVVYITGSSGTRLTVALSLGDSDSTTAQTIGILAENIAKNTTGLVITKGLLRAINTNSFNEDDVLYISPTTPGALTNTRPTAPNHAVRVGYVIKKAGSADGIIYVDPLNGYELGELHDVLITSVDTNHFLVYDNTAGETRWENRSPANARTAMGLGTLATLDGSGTANQIAYWSSTSNISSLTTATYPSLTELSYVKGVTSAIQTQLNAAATLTGNNAFTGANTFTNSTGQIFRQAATQDGILLRGRAGGTTSLTVEIVPTTLSGSRTLTAPDTSGTIAVGTGTSNELTYWSGTNTLSTLSTATYPSLTELSYVKGVTSGIQTQLNAKGTFTLPALTTGSVLFSNGTTIAQDNSNFFWDDTNNRLGIGTSSPQITTHIVSTGKQLRLAYDSNYWTNIGVDSSGNTVITGSVANSEQTNATLGPTGRLELGSINEGGQSDASKLDLTGRYGSNSAGHYGNNKVILYRNALTTAYYGLGISAGLLEVQAAGDIGFFAEDGVTTKTRRVTIKGDTGRVGIGTSSPSYTLDVNGKVNASSGVVTRVTGTTSSATPTPDADATDLYSLTALATNPTFGQPTGTPANGQKLMIRIKDNGTARTLSWNAAYVAGGVSLPTTTVAGKIMHLGFIYNTDNSLNKWMLIAKSEEA